MQFLALLVGLVGLWFGTEATIRGAIAISARLHISEFVVGVAVLSIGTDLPELAVAVDAALKTLQTSQASDIVVGSAIGSALGQIGLVLGVIGLTAHLTLPKRIVYQHGGMMLGSVVLLWLFALDGYVTHTEGFALVTAYAIYLAFVFGNAKKPQTGHVEQQGIGMAGATSYLVVGLATVVGSAELTVSSATQLALALAIDQSFIAVIIIGLGSSLPELSISLSAALKRRARLSVGNLIGSNIFDTLIPIGLGAIIADLEFGGALLRFELPVLFVLSGIVLAFFHQTRGIQKREASVILGLYLGYAVIKIASL